MGVKTEYQTGQVTITTETLKKKIIYCDHCKKVIASSEDLKDHPMKYVPYFEVTTQHFDWGNDSIDSIETFAFCSKECAMAKLSEYFEQEWDNLHSPKITIEKEYVTYKYMGIGNPR